MKTVDFILVNKKKTLRDKLISFIILLFTRGEEFCAHVAISFPYIDGYGPKILEATGGKVGFSSADKYEDIDNKTVLTLSVTDEQYDLMQKRAIEIAEHCYTYGYRECIVGGIRDVFGKKAGKLADKLLIKDDTTMDCSEIGTEIMRAPFSFFMSDEDPDAITPEHFFKHMLIENAKDTISIISVEQPQ